MEKRIEYIAELIAATVLEALFGTFILYLLYPMVSSIIMENIPTGISWEAIGLNNNSAFFKDYMYIAVFGILCCALLLRKFFQDRELIIEDGDREDDDSPAGNGLLTSLILGALMASILAPIMQILSQLSLLNFIIEILVTGIWNLISPIVELLGFSKTAEEVWIWYCANDLKFLFWSIYISIVASALGIPSVRTIFSNITGRNKKEE
ncbi:hypothetical protein ACFL08_03860 [Patescibacteria group bacterium]